MHQDQFVNTVDRLMHDGAWTKHQQIKSYIIMSQVISSSVRNNLVQSYQ